MTKSSQIKLYSYFRSSAAYRVRIALNYKKIDYEYCAVHLTQDGGKQYTADYTKLNPLAQVPCLVHQNKVISQSMAIIQYLDDINPASLLFPKDAYDRAVVTQLCEIVNSGIQPLQNVSVTNRLEKNHMFSSEDSKKWIQFWNHKGLQAIEEILKKTAGTFCYGDSFTAADCFLIPQVFSANRFGVDLSTFSKINKINEHCLTLDHVQKASPSLQPDAS